MATKNYVTYKDKYNKKYGYDNNASHTLEEISKDTGVSLKGLQQIYNKGIGAYKTNPTSVRPNVKSKEQWAMARVYSAVMGGKTARIDAKELKMEKGGMTRRYAEGGVIEDLESLLDFFEEGSQERLDIENEIKALKSQTKKDNQYSYLMTLDEYKNSGAIPLLQEYRKFVKKNEKSLLANDYSEADFMTLEEYLELGKDSSLYREKDIMGRPQTKSVEQVITDYFMTLKTQWGKKPEDYVPASKEIVQQNKKYREQLQKFFAKDKYGRIQVQSDELKSNKRAIKNAMENETYKKMLGSGEITIERLKEITDSVGVRITKDTLSGDKSVEFKETMAKELKNLPKKSYDELMQFSNQVKKELDVVGQEVYEKESKRITEQMVSSVGKRINQDQLSKMIPFWNMVSDYTDEKIYQEGWNNKKYYSHTMVSINSYDKQKFERQLKNYLDDYVEYLKWNIITAMVKTFASVTRPLKSYERIGLRIGGKGFEGEYKFIFDDGSSFILKTEGIGAGGYNIQRFHYRYLTNFIDYKLANGEKTDLGHFTKESYADGGMTRRYAEGGKITQYEIQSMRNYINSENPNPKIKASFEKVLAKYQVEANRSDLSAFPQGKYINPYDFSGYEYMRGINEEAGVSFLLTGEYELVSKAIYEKDYAMWLFYSYLGRINISFKACQDWLNQAQEYFEYTMPIPIWLVHTPRAKDGRSYAMWWAVSEDRKAQAESRVGRPLIFDYNGTYYYQEIGMVGNFDANNSDGWGSLYKEKKTGLLIPEYTETSFHFTTLIHEFAHCLDFQTQLVDNIEKFKLKPAKSDTYLNTEKMTDSELALYSKQIAIESKKGEGVSRPITNHFDEFVDALIRILRACAGGHIPLTQLYEQQALDVQQALAGTYGDLLLAQREKLAKERKELAKEDEMRENKRFSWQSSWINDVKKYVIDNALQIDLKEKLNRNAKIDFTLTEAIELDNLITGYFNTEFKKYIVENPSKATQRLEDIKMLKKETNRIINNHYDNVKSGYRYGFSPQNELEKYIDSNCKVRDFRDYKSWKECAKESLQNFQ